MADTFPGNATCMVGKKADGTFVVRLTLSNLPSEEYANALRLQVERTFNDMLRKMGGKIEGWE